MLSVQGARMRELLCYCAIYTILGGRLGTGCVIKPGVEDGNASVHARRSFVTCFGLGHDSHNYGLT